MSKKCLKAELLKKLFCSSIIVAKAEEPEATPEPTPTATSKPPQPEVNYEELIAKARTEEKNKLYPKIDRLEKELKAMTKLNNDNLLKCASLEKQLEGGESESVTKLKKEIKDLKEQLKTASDKSVSEESIRADIEKEYEVKFYKIEKLAEVQDEILPTFADLITGNTKEAIDESIEAVKAKTLETKKLLGLIDEEGNVVDKPAKVSEPAKVDKPRTVNPSNDVNDNKLFDLDYVSNLDPVRDREEYEQFRSKAGLK